MDATARLTEALRIVDAVDVPTDLRSAALGCVFGALGTDVAPTSGQDASRRDSGSAEAIGGLAGISSRLGVSSQVVEHVYVVEGNDLELVLPSGRLDQAKSKATEQIALLVAAGRQAAGLDDAWTGVDHIRSMCEHYRRHDQANFASTIKGMDEVFVIRGSGRDRRVKMSAPGWQRASNLVVELSTAES